MLVIPAIDLKGGRCVRLTEGREDSAKVYGSDPVETAVRFQSGGARLIHVVDLDAAFDGGGNRATIARIIASVGIPVEVGGGVRAATDIEELVGRLGARYVILGTVAVERPDFVAEAVEKFGDSIVVGVDARGSKVATRGWVTTSETNAVDLAKQVAGLGVGRIIYTDISRDGMLEGPALERTREVARRCGIRVTASGGVSSLEDLKQIAVLEKDGVDSVIIGKALYEGRFSLEEALEAVVT